MPLDDRRRMKAAIEQSAPGAASRHEGWEPPTGQQKKSDPPLEKHANFWGSVAKIGGGVSLALSVIGGGFTWAVKYVVREEMAQLRNDLDPLALKQRRNEPDDPKPPSLADRFDAQSAALNKIDRKIGSASDPQTDLGQKLDRIDKILTKQFGESTKTTPPPTVGPTARQRGQQ